MTFREKYGHTALVAGASEGMGAAYAHALAARGLDLVLIARRQQLLEDTAARIENQYRVNVLPVACDLASPDATRMVVEATHDKPIDFLVYNAASSWIGAFMGAGLETHLNIAAVNTATPLAMLHYYGGKMVQRRHGGVVLMASLAGFQGSGYLATYAATKAFCRVLAEGLWYEWRSAGVDVIACCAGATTTPNYLNTNPGKASWLEPRAQSPEDVVDECLRRIGTVPSFVSGRGNRWASFLMQHVFSRKKAVITMGEGMKKMYRLR
jgi:short-subunit dehydrogenase